MTYSAKHTLKGHNSNSKVVHLDVVILPTHDLRGYINLLRKEITHVSRSSRGVLRIFRPPLSSDAKIGDAQITVFIEDKVFWLDIPMNDTFVVNIL
jgi:hypothetical protein